MPSRSHSGQRDRSRIITIIGNVHPTYCYDEILTRAAIPLTTSSWVKARKRSSISSTVFPAAAIRPRCGPSLLPGMALSASRLPGLSSKTWTACPWHGTSWTGRSIRTSPWRTRAGHCQHLARMQSTMQLLLPAAVLAEELAGRSPENVVAELEHLRTRTV